MNNFSNASHNIQQGKMTKVQEKNKKWKLLHLGGGLYTEEVI